jgi:rod shape determining protein RodA
MASFPWRCKPHGNLRDERNKFKRNGKQTEARSGIEATMIKFDQRLILGFDWWWFLTLLALSGAGVLAIWSTTNGTGLNSYLGKQLIYLCCGLLAFVVLINFDYHIFSDFIVFIYAAGMAVLALVGVIGRTIHGNKSWIDIGIFSFQPSELVKIVVIIALAKYYSELDRETLGLKELAIGSAITFAPVLLIVLQKDLGTAITFLPIYAVLTCLAGIKKKHFIVFLIVVAVASPLLWFCLHGYRKERIQSVLNPSNDPNGIGYQARQSEIAIGSGRFLGKGFKQGSQGNGGFLPARHTDFVFAVLSEEKGFIGSITILGLFLFLTHRLYRAAREAKDKIGSMIVVGVLALLLFHLTINLGMVEGLLPVIGIPLPFVSAGGSSLISYFIAMSLCMGIRMRRYVN